MTKRGLLTLIAVSLALPAAAARPTFEDLVANLKSPNARTRQEAAAQLGKSGRTDAVAPLAALVRDPELRVRMEVVRALTGLRDRGAVPALTVSLGDGEPRIREEALGALVDLHAEVERAGAVPRFLRTFADEHERSSLPVTVRVDPSVYAGIQGLLGDPEIPLRESAAYALGILDGRPALPALAGALQDPAPEVRGAAATAIGKVGTAAEGRDLIALLGDAASDPRDRALKAIGVLQVREAAPVLRQMLEQKLSRDVSLRVMEALSRLADPAQAELFRSLAQDPDQERRRLAIEGLARVADGSMIAAFKKDFQRESSEPLRLALAFALVRLGDRAFVDTIVLSLPSRYLGERCRRYLLEMGRDLLPDLYPYLNDPEPEVRAALADVMAQVGDPAAIERLTPLISDPSAKVADRANRAVERLRNIQAVAQGGPTR
ncbi:MAG: HEAT repeat domain-containing protein [Vicinamibacteria bacterium]|nr:HEAT repeat domain-containing protein [Vicinamibacteria bacterium]